MKLSRHAPTQTRRDAWLEIDLGALETNTSQVRRLVSPKADIMAIVKADAYGHGAVMCIPTLEASGVSMVGVASMDEALQLRQAGLEIPILVIGLIPDWSVQLAAEHQIQLTVFAQQHLEILKNAYQLTQKPVKVHIKVDTGMHRIGIEAAHAATFINHCQQLPYLQVEGIFTHLACAEDPEITRRQQALWEDILHQVEKLPRYVHFANSAGTLGGLNPDYPQCHYNLVRLGLALYGYGSDLLTPAMGVKGRIVHLQDIPTGTGVSYNHRYISSQPVRLATLPLGYADGVPRILSNRIDGLLRGIRVPQVGSITMDQMMFDVSAVPDAVVGEAITLVGQEGGHRITLTDWAEKANTIEYELMCALRVRLPKIYTRS